MSLASSLLSGDSFHIGPSDVDDVVVSSMGRRGSYGPPKTLRGARVLEAHVTPADRGAPLLEMRLSYQGKQYEVTQRLDYLKELRSGKLVVQFGGSRGGPKNLVATLTSKANAAFQVWLDSLEEAGHTLVAYG